jgi:hypothetical protein
MGRDNTSTISFSVKTQLEPFFLSLEGLEVVLAFHNVTRMKPRESAKRTSHVRSVSVLVPPEAETLAALLPVALGNFPWHPPDSHPFVNVHAGFQKDSTATASESTSTADD